MQIQWLVFTDLDGTLLDERYRWDAATAALQKLRERGIPLVLNSSKTVQEMAALARELGTSAPLVSENGGVIAVPTGSEFAQLQPVEVAELVDGYQIHIAGLPRTTILECVHRLRQQQSWKFVGFSDWSIAEIAAETGLDRQAAQAAAHRLATEPILWQDTDARWAEFESKLQAHGIRALRGGHFIHLMGTADKADGLRAVLQLYRHHDPTVQWHTVALGDSPNDADMLNAADIAVVIPDSRGRRLQPTAPRVIMADAAGPVGWNTAVQTILDDGFHD